MVILSYWLLCMPGSRSYPFCLTLDNVMQLQNILHNPLREKCVWGQKCGMPSTMHLSHVRQDGLFCSTFVLPRLFSCSKKPFLWCSPLSALYTMSAKTMPMLSVVLLRTSSTDWLLSWEAYQKLFLILIGDPHSGLFARMAWIVTSWVQRNCYGSL